MAQVHINNIVVGNNPAPVLDPLSFHITFESFNALPGTFDWKIIYIGSPEKPDNDQVIDSFEMNDLQAGVMQFTVESNAPNFKLIPPEEIIGTPLPTQAPLPSSSPSPTRSRSSSAAATTSATATRRACSRNRSTLPTSTSANSNASSWLRTHASSGSRSSGPSAKGWSTRTPTC
jgi:hypothetical protein